MANHGLRMWRGERVRLPLRDSFTFASLLYSRERMKKERKKNNTRTNNKKDDAEKKQQRPFILFRVPRCVWCVPKVPTRLSDGGREYIIHALPNRTMVRVFHLFFSPFLLTNRKRKLSFFFAFFLEMDIFLHSGYFVEHLKNIDGLITCGFKDTFSK